MADARCRTKPGYDTCKTGVTPGDYFHHVELPHIYRQESEIDAQIDLQKSQNETCHHQKKSNNFLRASNNDPFMEKISA